MIEKITEQLNQIYESYGYRRFRMSKFETYDLYAQNRDFLKSSKLITFTDVNGALLALKPDITLSIIKNNKGEEDKVYYNEMVYRAQENTFKEMLQVGVECIGMIDSAMASEVLMLAIRSLQCISSCYRLNLSDVAFINAVIAEMQVDIETRKELLQSLEAKNTAAISRMAQEGRIREEDAAIAISMIQIRPIQKGLQEAGRWQLGAQALGCLERLKQAARQLEACGMEQQVYLDFSLVNSMDYYNGLIFQGFVEEVPCSVLSGGRYDRLPEKMGKQVGAIGFALYMDRIDTYLKHEKKNEADILLVYEQYEDEQAVLYAQKLRQQGKRVRMIERSQLEQRRRAPVCEQTIFCADSFWPERKEGKE